MKNKKILVPPLIVITLASIIAIIVILTNRDNDDDNYKINGIDLVENKDILKDAEISNLKITNVSLLTRDKISTFKALVSNDTENEIFIDQLYVKFYLKDNEQKILVLSGTKLAANAKTYINITSEIDLSKTTEIEYILEK